jgi:hypothetical protein
VRLCAQGCAPSTVIYPQLRDFIAEHNKVPRHDAEEVEA